MRARPRRTALLKATALMTVAALASAVYSASAREDDPAEGMHSLVGSYLSGRFARNQFDTPAAAEFYKSALERDPGNDVLLEQAFQMETAAGNWKDALPLAEQLVAVQPSHRLSRVYLGITDFKAGNFAKADEHFKATGDGPVGELTGALTRAWAKLGDREPDASLALLELPKQADWAQFYLRYHRALIADLGGRHGEAKAAYERIFKQDPRTLRTVLAYVRHAVFNGDPKLAKAILKEHIEKSQGEVHPLVRELRDRVEAGEKLELLVRDPSEGLAEVFYGLGEALTGEGGVTIGILYLQMALYLKEDQPFALAALANAHEASRRYTDAIDAYDRIPKGSPLQAAIDIRKAFNLNSLERVDEAKSLLEDLMRQDPTDLKALDALGNIMRSRKRYEESVVYYDKAIAAIGKPDRRHWGYYYARGTSFERLKQWPKAEADLLKALELAPDQAMTLNYLGYSWIDQNKNLKQGLELIEKAVKLKPDDGYIVDSLGWAHFKLGNFKEAVRYLERSVEIKPDDPVLNDHFGDALWRVGREREARFQWDQALSFNPEPEDAEKIKQKLVNGLPPREVAKAPVKKPKEVRRSDKRKSVQKDTAPSFNPFF